MRPATKAGPQIPCPPLLVVLGGAPEDVVEDPGDETEGRWIGTVVIDVVPGRVTVVGLQNGR
ncbi:hypothetical protein [Thermococcus sp.]|uniref:hypothetical protein n=1 Tax=Thermococcus sp. TaxID=35749 RepID=UPI00260A6700|nr:hypothetical protein [Thermococcus sp.]